MLVVAYAKVEVRAITACSLRYKKVKRSNDKESRVSHDENNFVPPTKYGFYLVPKYITKPCNILQFFCRSKGRQTKTVFLISFSGETETGLLIPMIVQNIRVSYLCSGAREHKPTPGSCGPGSDS